MSDTEESRPKRTKRESSYKTKAFEKFKRLKSGTRGKYEIEEIDNVYETVDEREYTKQVLDRQDDWIVDDDGSGYVEDGRDVFDDDLDAESIAAAERNKGKGTKRKKRDISDSAGKGKLQHLLANMPTKKKEEKKLDNDDTLSELLGELDAPAGSPSIKPKPVASSYSFSAKKAEKDYMKSFKTPKIAAPTAKPAMLQNKDAESNGSGDCDRVLEEIQPHKSRPSSPSTSSSAPSPPSPPPPRHHPKKLFSSSPPPPTPPPRKLFGKEEPREESQSDEMEISQVESEVAETQQSSMIEDLSATQNCFDDDFDETQIEDVATQAEEKGEVDWENLQEEMMKEWAANSEIASTEEEAMEGLSGLESDKEVFRFFWWDAFEDAAKQPGVVFLFGKTYNEEIKAFESCCVAVRNIERKLYFLPRTTDEDTGDPVTAQDVYTEIKDSVMKSRQVKNFKARPISKKYAFNPEVPLESDYVEVRYSASDPSVSSSTQGRTFSRVFGSESSYLEILLLDRKIKGPCWLEVADPVKVTNPITWCKIEVNCTKAADLKIIETDKCPAPPPLVVTAINIRCAVNPKTQENEIVMISCITNSGYSVDKQAPNVPFHKHFCVFTCPQQQVLPLDLHAALMNYKVTTVQKINSERALLNYFLTQFAKIDCDLVVGHDLQGYQINILCDRLVRHQNQNFSKFGRVKRSLLLKQKMERELFTGRLVCDTKISAKELIKSRSYDLDSLCQSVLKLKEGQRIDLEPEDVPKMFLATQDFLKLVLLTMNDASYILKIMFSLNIVPLALQITSIAGNVMSRTLMGGRSERNEYLLLHAFSEKGYIVPDKVYRRKGDPSEEKSTAARKKPAYSGGLVLDPKVGFYDKYVLLMDFNSLYPSIIQEYNICFTTLPPGLTEDNMVLPDSNLPAGILPTEIRKLVESRREVKKLMNNADLSSDLRGQYNIRQMALKLTANSMYGCLGFSNSRFYAKSLAALITHKGREILTNTRDLVQKVGHDVIYGDTDSLMINTNITDYEQVFKIGSNIKRDVNKLYRQVELDIDGVFKYLLLLKKKKYAAVTLTKGKNGELRTSKEYKGLDVVRRDWSQLSAEAGKFILDQILSDQGSDERIDNVRNHLVKLKQDLEAGEVPLSLLVITKQLTKNPNMYPDKNSLPHVQVALRYNKDSGGHLRAGDTVPYVICVDGTSNSATQRAYHVEELKSSETLKIDTQYYLAQQIHPVVSRICDPIEGLDAFQIADFLGLDTAAFKKTNKQQAGGGAMVGENITRPEVKFRDVDKFKFNCPRCKTEVEVSESLQGGATFLEKCANAECKPRPVEYLQYIKKQLDRRMRGYVEQYYLYEMICEDPMCPNLTTEVPVNIRGRFPVCTMCDSSVLMKKYTEFNLYSQLTYFQYIFDLDKMEKRPLLEQQIEKGYTELKELVEDTLDFSAYSIVNLTEMFSLFSANNTHGTDDSVAPPLCSYAEDYDEDEDAQDDVE